ncbi:MAG: rhodanese-like domain-containing protein [Pseudomonadota bacterium]
MASVDVTETDPVSAWNALKSNPDAQLVDVRTRAEWSFVGAPDLSSIGKQTILLEWRSFPAMAANEGFVESLLSELKPTVREIYFICRSGARSMDAARAVAARLGQEARDGLCVNVAEGFEGDLDGSGHRGTVGGWKMHGLAWRQS